jgi:hypothetical protein
MTRCGAGLGHSHAALKVRPAGGARIGFNLKGSPAAYVGHVRAADEKEAIRKAIHEFQITNPEHQKRLAAERVD